MEFSGVSQRTLCLCIAATLLVSCGESQTTIGPFLTNAGTPNLAHPSHSQSWMSPDARTIKQLLYVSDQRTDYVYVYEYGGTHRAVGKLTGFRQPDGQCVDAKGDIWITDTLSSAVLEYAHGASEPMATLNTGRDTNPIGCSVAPNGDLAVTNNPVGSSPGSLEVFRHASGRGKIYKDSAGCDRMYSPGYDLKNNLYVEGSSETYGGACELPAGGHSLAPVHANVNLNYPGGLMWDGKYLAVSQTGYMSTGHTVIFQMSEKSDGSLKEQYEITLDSSSCGSTGDLDETPQPFIVGTANTPVNNYEGYAVVGGNLYCNNEVEIWAYPAGNEPLSTLRSAPAQPYGESVSIAP